LLSEQQSTRALGLSGIRQDELATPADLTNQGIMNNQDASILSNEGTMTDVMRVYSDRQGAILENGGVTLSGLKIQTFEGRQGFSKFYETIHEHLRSGSGDICVSGVDERLFAKYRENPESHRSHMAKLVKQHPHLKMRILIEEGDYYFTAASYASYRWQPNQSFSPTAFYVFGDYLALISFTHPPAPLVLLVRSAAFAQAYRHSFDLAWQAAIEPPKQINKLTFLGASIDWFLGRRSAHMGPGQYVGYAGLSDDDPRSGAFLWAKAEVERSASSGNMVSAEVNLLRKVAAEIGTYVPYGTAIIELGPGTTTAFRSKTLPIIHGIGSKICVLVDGSRAFLKELTAANDLVNDLDLRPVEDNFFENENAYFSYEEEPALICSFGSTISNIVNPVCHNQPQEALVNSLSKMSRSANSGWMLIGFDSDQDGERVKSYFQEHALFQLNIFDCMASALPITGDFDPGAFEYEPQWIASSSQLAHFAVVRRNLSFKLDETVISLEKGRKLHIKNSYKFSPDFFERCCKLAGLEVIRAWSDHSPAKVYLLEIPQRRLTKVGASAQLLQGHGAVMPSRRYIPER
jgi:uncharacterized SAM-dependent methyltransferase